MASKVLPLKMSADTVVELGAGFSGVDVLLLSPNDLAQIRLREKTHRSAGPVVQIGGVGDEFLARLLDEADVQRGADGRVAQLLGWQALERFVEGKGVQEDGARNVGGIRRQAAVMLGVDFLCQRLCPRAGDIVAMAGT